MPTYDYKCDACALEFERAVPVDERDGQPCHKCGRLARRMLSAPLFRFKGRVTPGGGPDRFTADMLGIPLKELPEGLRTKGDK